MSKNSNRSSKRFTRRSFLKSSAVTIVGATVASNSVSLFSERAEAFLNAGAFWKKPSTGNGQTSNGYTIGQSLRFNSSANAYLSRTPSVAGNRKTWTWSGWVKRGSLGMTHVIFGAYDNASASDDVYSALAFGPSDSLVFTGWSTNWRATSQVFRDPSAWYHIVCALDTTQTTASDRVKIYCNGIQITSFSVSNNPGSSADLGINSTVLHNLGRINYYTGSGPYPFDGYLAEVNFVEGYPTGVTNANWAATNIATLFGETDANTGQWIPKAYSGAYGANGYYLKFADDSATTATTLGKDSAAISGAHTTANNWTPTNFATHDQVLDSPTNNFATLHPYSRYFDNPSGTLTATNGNMKLVGSGLSAFPNAYYAQMLSSIGVTTDKIYYEMYADSITAANGTQLIFNAAGSAPNTWFSWRSGEAYGKDGALANARYNITTGDYLGVAYDGSTGNIWLRKNGTWIDGDPTTPYVTRTWTGGTLAFGAQMRVNDQVSFNFGQGGQSGLTYSSASGGRFKYTPPTGFKALSTANLSAPAVKKGSDHFSAVTYSGGDPYWANVTFLSHMDSSPPVDVSASPVTVSVTGASVYSTVNSKFGGSSAAFVSTNNLVMSSAPFNFGSQNFTIEFWVYRTSATGWLFGNYTTWATNTDLIGRFIGASGALQLGVGGDLTNSAFWYSTTSTVPASTWTHVAFVRNGNTFKTYINGVADATTLTYSGSITPLKTTTHIGRAPDGTETLSGYLDEYRVTKGVARYTANFTPPATAFAETASTAPTTSFQPDLVWIKNRTQTLNYAIFDSARGATKYLSSNTTAAETTDATSLTAFTASGFTLGSASLVNNSGDNFAAWCWKKGPTPGFDVAVITNKAPVGHDAFTHALGAIPKFAIVKRSDSSSDWYVYHSSRSALNINSYFVLNGTSAEQFNADIFGMTPTATQFYVGGVFPQGSNLVAYLWNEIAGFSKFGSYTGNGAADGPFVYCGFKPRWILFKQIDASLDWRVRDSGRDLSNPSVLTLAPSTTGPESGGTNNIDFVSNGFKIQTSAGGYNASGGTYIFAAFAEAPLKYATAR